jgi:geranylgeranyl diphosphate synthase type II
MQTLKLEAVHEAHAFSTDFTAVLKQTMLEHCASSGPQIVTMVQYHLENSGSLKRAKLCYQTATALNIDELTALQFAAVVELLHNVSLIHDDIQDQEALRRHTPSLWVKYGEALALCAGDSMIVGASLLLAQIRSNSSLSLQTRAFQAVQHTIRGQAADLSETDKIGSRSYRTIAFDKAAPLIQLSIYLPTLHLNLLPALQPLVTAAGQFALAYQLYDDIVDFEQDRQTNQLNAVNLHQQASAASLAYSQQAVIDETQTLLASAYQKCCIPQSGCAAPLQYLICALRDKVAEL